MFFDTPTFAEAALDRGFLPDEPRRVEPDAAFVPDDDASHVEEERRHAAARWSQAQAL